MQVARRIQDQSEQPLARKKRLLLLDLLSRSSFDPIFHMPKQQNDNYEMAISSSKKHSRSLSSLYSIISKSHSIVCFILVTLMLTITSSHGTRMVRLCIASVDPMKLSSQCVMCNRREFPLTAIDCTGITKMNDLISNPLSVQEATCLIYNCRRQVPEIKPEPYHGSVSSAMRANYPSAAGTRTAYGVIPPPGMFTPPGYPPPLAGPMSSSLPRYPIGYSSSMQNEAALTPQSPLAAAFAQMLSGGRQQALPYGFVPPQYPYTYGKK